MVIKIIILVHLSISAIAILMGKYLPNMVHKENEREVFSFIYCCLLPIMNIVVVCIGLCKLFDGIRQDSGDEFQFVMKAIARYKELGIDPSTKTIIFSNALTFDKAEEIQEYCRGRIRCAFGIGTNLTNDTGFKPSNIVMKLTSCRMNKNQPVFNCVKLSDDLGKHTGDTEEVKHCIQTISKF